MRKMVVMLSLAMPALAQVTVVVPPPPAVTFQVAPPLVEVQPGVQVFENHDEEIFYTDGFYWVRHGKHWYRTADHRGGWVVVDAAGVPAVIVKSPKGKYKHYKMKKAVMVTPTGEVVKVKYKKEKKHKH